MGKKNAKGRSTHGGTFTKLDEWMMRTQAWQSLTPTQRILYVELRRRYVGSNNGFIGFGHREAAEACNISKNSVGPNLAVLEDRGFIEVASPGAFNQKARRASEYRLTEERCNRTGALPSKAYFKWRPSEGIRRPNSGTCKSQSGDCETSNFDMPVPRIGTVGRF